MAELEERNLPPLEWLRVFEAAGRLGNFTAVGREIGLTQATVSQRISALEANLGVKLFRRLARGVELTVDGDAYLPYVQNALSTLRRGTGELFEKPRTKCVIAAPVSVLALWIAPRLHALSATFPKIQFSLSSIHRLADYESLDTDYEVRFGNGSWEGLGARELYREALAPLCAPELLKGAKQWRDLPIIAVGGPRDGWIEWARVTGERPVATPSLRFDAMITALEAANNGAGVVLASLPLARKLLEKGELIELGANSITMNAGSWLTWSDKKNYFSINDAICDALCPTKAE